MTDDEKVFDRLLRESMRVDEYETLARKLMSRGDYLQLVLALRDAWHRGYETGAKQVRR